MVSVEGRAEVVHVLGDSNGHIYDALVCRVGSPERLYVVRTFYTPQFNLTNICDDAGTFHADLSRQLVDALVIAAGDRLTPRMFESSAVRARIDHGERMESLARAPRAPALVFSVGHMDFAVALAQLGPSTDLMLSGVDYPASPVSAVGSTYAVPLSLIDEVFASRFERLERALVRFRSGGFDRVYLFGLRPPTLDDSAFERFVGVRSQAHLRYKLSLYMNHHFRAVCVRVGATFVDLFEPLARDGVFDDRFELDYLHVNRAAAERILATFAETLATRDAPLRNPALPPT